MHAGALAIKFPPRGGQGASERTRHSAKIATLLRLASRLAFDRGAVAECQKRDRYGRKVCLVRVDDVDVGLAQIEAGLAWWYRKYAREQSPQDRATYAAVEQDAQQAKRGLWRDKDHVPPWGWRSAR